MPAPSTYTIVLQSEQNGRVLRRVNGVSERNAHKIAELLDTGADVSMAAMDLVGAVRTIGRALEPLTRATAKRKLPARRR